MEYINRLLRKGGSKKSDPVGSHQLPGEKKELSEENDFSQCQQSTPVKHLDCDTESDTTAEYESAGEASPWEKPSNVSALADYLAGVHLSTPNKIHNELTYFPFSPISAEDECDDEVTAIISNGSQSSSHTLSFHEKEEISISKQDKTFSHVVNTSLSDVDPEEFKNSAPCKRHSETNVSSFLHSETLQLSGEDFAKSEVNFASEMSCSVEENILQTPSFNESEEIVSSVVATVEKLCDSVNNKVTSSETISPNRYASLNLSSSDDNIECTATDPTASFIDNERKLVNQSSASESSTNFSSSNKSPVSVVLEKDVTSLDSLEENNVTVISDMNSSSNVLETSHSKDYVTNTKHKIDTIFSSNKEIVSNVICETKQQIDNMFKRKSPIKELASNSVSHVIDSIKHLNVTESELSPQKNVIIEKISSPISSVKQKIDNLFSPKKTILNMEKTTASEVFVASEICGNELLKKDSNETNQNNISFNIVNVEHLDLDPSVSGLKVIPLTAAFESHEVIETAKQQIDKIFKSLSPPKVTAQSEVLELSNSTTSTDLEHEDDIGITPSQSTSKSGILKDELTSSLNDDVVVNAKQEIGIGQIAISSSKEQPGSCFVLNEYNKSTATALEDFNEICIISEVTLPVDLKSDVSDNLSKEVLASNTQPTDIPSDEILHEMTDEVSDTTRLLQDVTVVEDVDEKTGHDVDDEQQVIKDSVSLDRSKMDEHSSDHQSTSEILKKDVHEADHIFQVSPKKESFNVSLSSILNPKEEVGFSAKITEPLLNVSESHSQETINLIHTTNSQPEISIASNIDESIMNSKDDESFVSDFQNIADVKISPLESSEVIGDKIIGTCDHMVEVNSTEVLDLQISPESVGSSDVNDPKEVDDIAELHETINEEVIDNQIVCNDPNDGPDCDSQLKPQQEALDITDFDQNTSRKEESEDFVVINVVELDKHASAPVPAQISSSEFKSEELLDSSPDLGKIEGESNGNKQGVDPTSEVVQVEIAKPIEIEKNHMEPSFPHKESMIDDAEVVDSVITNTGVKKLTTENNEKNDVEPSLNTSECSLVADVINVQENVKCSSLTVSSIEEKNDVSDTVSVGHQLLSKSLEVMPPHVKLVKEVESISNITENNFSTASVLEKEVMDVIVSSEIKIADVNVKEIDKNFSAMNENSNFIMKTDDSISLKNGMEQPQSSTGNSHSSGLCNMNMAPDKKIVDSDKDILQNDEQINVNLNKIPITPIKEDGKTHDFEFNQIQSESKQDQKYTEESTSHLSSKLEENKSEISKMIGEKQIEQSSSIIPKLDEKVSMKLAHSNDNETLVKNINKDTAMLNESVVICKNEAYKFSSNGSRRSPPGPEVANDLFNEIFQHGKDQMCRIINKYSEDKQSRSEVSVTQQGTHEITRNDCNTATFTSKSTGIATQEDGIFKNTGFSSGNILCDKVKSPPFACPVSSNSITFGSPSEYSLSLSPIDSYTAPTKCESPKSSDIPAGNSSSIVSYNKTHSSSAEIGMGLKSSHESLEIVKSDLSLQKNELSPSLQATVQIQGEMSSRNEKYSYNINKSSKDIRGSPINKSSEEFKYSGLSDNFRTFKLDDLSKSTIERKSYEDLLDRCLEQERLLGFDETIKEEADKLIKEIANASSDDICVQPDDFPPTNANNSEAGPVTADEDLNKADLFQDATLFDFDYLSKIGKGKPSRRLVRESLFLKFDPLAAAAAAGATPEPAQEMAQADSSDVINTPPRAPPLHNGDDQLVSITPNDEVVCSPASSTVATPPRSKARTSSCSATPTLRHEILSKEISKLQELMMRQESSYQEQIAACTEEVEQLREQLAELEARDNQADLQAKLAATEAEAVKLRKELAEATESKKQLMMIMEEYEKTISQVVTMREDDRKKFEIEKEQISMEREGALLHLRNMEIAFNDVHQKYEKCKEVIEAFKHNEEQYKISLNENRKTIIQQEENYQKLKEHAAQKLEQANIEISEMKKAHQAEIAKMVAVQRKMEIRVKSLEESLEQKKREAAELTKICDDLITKVEQ